MSALSDSAGGALCPYCHRRHGLQEGCGQHILEPMQEPTFHGPQFAPPMVPYDLRDWFAGQALSAIRLDGVTSGEMARLAYCTADSMIEERKKEPKS